MHKNILITVLVAIIVGGIGFVGGMQYQKSQAISFGGQNGQFGRGGMMYGRGLNGRMGPNSRATLGQVVSTDSTGLTVKLTDGSSKIIVVSGSTMFVKTASASSADIHVGDRVMVFGTQNSDGSMTAQNVQINPPMRSQQPSASPTQAAQ